MVVPVEQHLGALRAGRGDGMVKRRDDRRGLEEHRRAEQGRGVIADGIGEARGEGVDGVGVDEIDADALLGEATELSVQGVKLAAGGDEVSPG